MENGNCVIVEKLTHNICYGSTEFIVFRQSQQISNKMLYYFFRNTNFRKVFENNMRGSAGQKRISSDFIGNFLMNIILLNFSVGCKDDLKILHFVQIFYLYF